MDPKDTKSHVENAVPSPIEHLSEDQKKALELSGEIEHVQGVERKKVHDDAEELGNSKDA
ncbi:MAG: hypothetical protein JWL59_1729 [Chthoniobacteraceae bacterium]|nr:hypothetical protein [Chthoniobacteraceae bacterium]